MNSNNIFRLMLITAILVLSITRTESAMSSRDSLRMWTDIYNAPRNAQDKIDALMFFSIYYKHKDLHKSECYANEGFQFCQSQNDSSYIEEFRFQLADIHYYTSDYEQSIEEFLKFVDYHKQHKNYLKIIEAKNIIGFNYAILNMHQKSITEFLDAYKMSKKHNYQNYVSKSNLHLGRAFYSLNQYEYALDYFSIAKNEYQKIKDMDGQANVDLMLGITYSRLFYKSSDSSLLKKALDCYNEAFLYYNQIGEKGRLSQYYRYLADYYLQEATLNLPLALDLLLKGIDYAENINNRSYQGDLLTIAAYVYGRMGDFRKNLEYNIKAMKVRDTLGSKALYTSSLINVAGNKLVLNKLEDVEVNIREAIAISKMIDHKLYLKNSYKILYQYFKNLNHYDSALKYNEYYIQLQTELAENDSKRQVSTWKLRESFEKFNAGQQEIIRQQKLERSYFAVAIIMISIVAMFLFFRYRAKKKNQKVLEDTVLLRTQELQKTNSELKLEIQSRIDAQEELRKSEERLRLLLENISHIAVIGYDRLGNIHFWNNASTAIFGYSKDYAWGRNLFELITIDNLNPNRLSVDLNNTEILKAGEINLTITRNSKSMPCFVNHFIDKPDEDSPTIFSLFIDLSVQKKAQEDFRQLNEELEQRVDDRTKALNDALSDLEEENEVRRKTEIEVRKAKDDLARALEAEKELTRLKTSILTRMSHEYRTPLTVILSSAQLMDYYFDNQDKEHFQDHISRISKAVEAMNNLLHDVMTVSLPQNMLESHDIDNFEIAEICIDEIENKKLLDGGKHVFKFIDNFKDEVTSNRSFIKLIFSNLLTNAVKFSEPGSEIITEISGNGNNYSIIISDQGKGIVKDEFDKIFEQFYRGSNVEEEPGIGLGLTIVKAYTEALNGNVVLSSQIGTGTSVKVSFPKQLS